MSYTDPTGFSWWTNFRDKWLRPILSIAASVVFAPGAIWALGSSFMSFGAFHVWAGTAIPIAFDGQWKLSVEKQRGFPWWEQIKYPVVLTIDKTGVLFVDQSGFSCRPTTVFFDEDIGALVFKSCLPTKSELAFPPFYRFQVADKHITGEVLTYKLLFRLKGISVVE